MATPLATAGCGATFNRNCSSCSSENLWFSLSVASTRATSSKLLSTADCQVADFGLAREISSAAAKAEPTGAGSAAEDESDYYRHQTDRKVPMRWTAPETLLSAKWSFETDLCVGAKRATWMQMRSHAATLVMPAAMH